MWLGTCLVKLNVRYLLVWMLRLARMSLATWARRAAERELNSRALSELEQDSRDRLPASAYWSRALSSRLVGLPCATTELTRQAAAAATLAILRKNTMIAEQNFGLEVKLSEVM